MNEIIVLLKKNNSFLFTSFPNWLRDSVVGSNFAKRAWTAWSSSRSLLTPCLYWNLGFKKYATIKLSKFSILLKKIKYKVITYKDR